MNKYENIRGVIQLLRPQSVFLMLMFIYIPVGLKTLDWIEGIWNIIPLYLLLTGEIILNDYMDVDKDKINKGHRPLAAGSVSLSLAKWLICLFLSLSFITSIVIYSESKIRLVLFLTVLITLTIYSFFINRLAIIKTFITAFTTVICLCFIFTFIGFNKDLLFFILSAFFYICSRELLMDIRDYEGDKKFGCNTLAIFLGKKNTYILAVFFMACSQLIYLYFFIIKNNWIVKSLWIITISIVVIAFYKFRELDSKKQNNIVILLWIPMLLSMSSIIS